MFMLLTWLFYAFSEYQRLPLVPLTFLIISCWCLFCFRDQGYVNDIRRGLFGVPLGSPFTVSRLGHRLESWHTTYVFLGYPQNKKGYKVLAWKTKKLFDSRDVYFHKEAFPFVTNSLNSPSVDPSTMFPSPIIDQDLSNSTSCLAPQNPSNVLPSNSPVLSTNIPLNNLAQSHISQNIKHDIDDHPSFEIPIDADQPVAPSTRVSGRVTKKPSYLKDFVCNSVILTNFTTTCFSHPTTPNAYSFNALSLNNQVVLKSLSNLFELVSFTQAWEHPGWRKAMEEEVKAL